MRPEIEEPSPQMAGSSWGPAGSTRAGCLPVPYRAALGFLQKVQKQGALELKAN